METARGIALLVGLWAVGLCVARVVWLAAEAAVRRRQEPRRRRR